MLATLTQSGRAAMIAALAEKTLHFAWGTGDPAWDADSTLFPPLYAATELTAEVGRRLVQIKNFCEPNPEGDITLPEGFDKDKPLLSRYQSVTYPTPHLYVRVTFDYGEAWQHCIREVGLFAGGETDPALPPGQLYFEPHQVANRGLLVAARHEEPTQRDPARKDTYEFVLSL